MAQHTASGSDHISKLTAEAGFTDWRTLWEANAAIQKQRHNPNLLFKGTPDHPGDELTIPDRGAREVSAGTGRRHSFVMRSHELFLRLRILKSDFSAVPNARYSLTVQGAPAPFSGNTDGNGQIEVEIPPAAQRGELTVWMAAADTDPPGAPPSPSGLRGPVPVAWTLQIGALNPILEQAPDEACISGVQQRLNNLGFQSGPIDGVLNDATRAAVAAFQQSFTVKHDRSGWPGPTGTQLKLRDLHDKPDTILGPLAAPQAAPSEGTVR